jgi:outer membrane protein, heavy metal efflux system
VKLEWTVRAVLAGGLLSFGLSCVSADAGYPEVRDATSQRLQKDVRWSSRDSSRAADEQTRKLLAAPVDVESAVQIALLNNQGLQADFEELGIARSRLVAALALPNPTVDAALRYSPDRSSDPGIDVEALIDLTAFVFLPFRAGAAGASLDAARLGVTGRVLDVAFQTRVAFYAYQAAEQTLELRRSIMEALGASFEVTRRLHEAGNVNDLTFANERALYEESRLAYTDAEAAVRARREGLNAQMGLWGRSGVGWTVSGRLPEPPEGELDTSRLEARAAESSIDLSLRRRRYAAAARTANVQRLRGWVPELRAGVSAERELGADGDWSIGPALALEVPLLYQGAGEAGVALAEMRREQRLYSDTAIRLRATARATASRLQAATKSAAYYKSVLLPLRQQVVDETQLQFNAMNVGVFQLLQAKRDQIETARAYVDVLRQYWTARAEVDQLLAGRLPRTTTAAEEPMNDGDTGGGEEDETH